MKTYKIKNKNDYKKVMSQINDSVQELADKSLEKAIWAVSQEALKDSNKYIPFDTGALLRSSIVETFATKGLIQYNTPYAKRLYYGISLNFSKDANPQASAYWWEKGTKGKGSKYTKIYKTLWNETKKEVF